LEDFKAGFQNFDENTQLNADQRATLEGLEKELADSDTNFQLASVAMQKENAAEVAKAKAAAKVALDA
jgi:hypothetical protein